MRCRREQFDSTRTIFGLVNYYSISIGMAMTTMFGSDSRGPRNRLPLIDGLSLLG